ncbi:MAG: segregation/condensation protein A [Elusimicrobia bacterium]|jgi:segregation and condensation protein A|nr:segregation/condensation protein A [Elusimicrobiota bacterium]
MADIFLKKKRSDWKVDINNFEGPLDLLLYLIKKKNLDIYDIPIAEITNEYLEYIKALKEEQKKELNNVGDFLVMASVLMRIKSRMLLPDPDIADDGDEESAEDMKRRLIERLIEYKKYKETVKFFRKRNSEYENVIPLRAYPLKEFGQSVDATLFDLIDAFKEMIENATEDVKLILKEEISTEDRMRYIMDLIQSKKNIEVSDIADNADSVMELIVTLLAILELVRSHQISIIQDRKFGKIQIKEYDNR